MLENGIAENDINALVGQGYATIIAQNVGLIKRVIDHHNRININANDLLAPALKCRDHIEVLTILWEPVSPSAEIEND
jgi:hypothetical protein